jgi:hypothetical protein
MDLIQVSDILKIRGYPWNACLNHWSHSNMFSAMQSQCTFYICGQFIACEDERICPAAEVYQIVGRYYYTVMEGSG